MALEDKDATSNTSVIEDLSATYTETGRGGVLKINPLAVASNKWQEMINLTQKDQQERGVVVSKNGSNFFTSKIFTGLSDRYDRDDPTKRIEPASFSTPLLAHGLKSLMPGTRDIVIIHTHYIPPELDRLQTHFFSDSDIRTFVNSNLNGAVLIDRGGAHLLVRTHPSYKESALLKTHMVRDILTSVTKNKGKVLDVIKSVSSQLSTYGLGYFYTPSLLPTQEGYIEFKDPNSTIDL